MDKQLNSTLLTIKSLPDSLIKCKEIHIIVTSYIIAKKLNENKLFHVSNKLNGNKI